MLVQISDVLLEAKHALVNRDHRKAHQLLSNLIARDPDIAEAYFLLARIAHEMARYEKEQQCLQRALVLQPENAEYLACLAKSCCLNGENDQALALIQQTLVLPEQTAQSWDTIGVVYNRLSLYAEAAEAFSQSVAIDGSNAAVYFNLGSTLKFCGKFDQAGAAYEQAIRLSPDFYKAHAALTSLGNISKVHHHLDRLIPLFERAETADEKLLVAHAISKESEALGDYAQSMTYLQQAKLHRLQQLDYQPQQELAVFEQLKHLFKNRNDHPERGFRDNSPLFVVGMPRSGTTVVERILSGHSSVATAGELHNISLLARKLAGVTTDSLMHQNLLDHIERIDPRKLGEAYIQSTRYLRGDHARLLDKLPLNVLYAGLIIEALPDSKIICLDRNPLDTIMSNYRQLFSFHDKTYAYSLSLALLTDYYIEFYRLIHFWQARYPEHFYLINYESLVNDPQQEVAHLLTFCNLPWEPRCLAIEKNEKPVATASAVQARQAISSRSVGQWRQYENYLQEVKSKLNVAGIAVER